MTAPDLSFCVMIKGPTQCASRKDGELRYFILPTACDHFILALLLRFVNDLLAILAMIVANRLLDEAKLQCFISKKLLDS